MVQASSEVSLANGVVKVNELVSRVVEVNREMRADYTAQRDAGLQAKLHNALEDLSELVDTAVLYAEDGSASVYLGGQSLLVIGGESYPLQADTARWSSPPSPVEPTPPTPASCSARACWPRRRSRRG